MRADTHVRSSFFIVLMLSAALVAGDVTAQEWYDTYTGWAVDTQPVLPNQEVHPSLWFRASDISALKTKRSADEYAESRWNIVQTEIARYKALEVANASPNSRPIMARVLAFAWVMDDDAAARDKAIEVLRTAYDDVPRTVEPGPGDFRLIYRATWLQNYLSAYDWIQPVLSAAADADIRARLIEEAQLLRDNIVDGVRYAPRPHNHRSKPAWALASAALALSDHPQAADWLEHALELSNTVTRYQFSHDGIYREGGHYHMYNMVNLIPFLWHYKNVSGVDLFEDFRPGFEWPVEIRLNRGSMPNIEDSFLKPMPMHMVAAAYTETPTTLHSSASLGNVLQWHWQNTTVVPVNYSGATNDVIWELDEFLTYDPSINPAEPDVSPTRFVESGQIAFRDTWTYGQSDARYMLFHGVASGDNHNHPDNLSYFVEANGALLAVDAGYGASGFGDANRSWYTSSEAHNLVTMNNAGPADWEWNIGPSHRHFLDTPFYDFAEMEAPMYAAGTLTRRGIAFPNERFWVVYDVIESPFEADFHLNVHGRATRVRDFTRDGNRVTWTSPATFGQSARLHAYLLGSEPDASIEEKSGLTSLVWDHAETQYYVRMRQRGTEAAFLHLLYPGGSQSSFPPVTDLSDDGVIAFSVTDQGRDSHFALNRSQAEVTIGSASSDAFFFWTDDQGGHVDRFAMTRGRVFGWNGRTILEVTEQATIAAEAVAGMVERVFIESAENGAELLFTPSPGGSYDAVDFDGGSFEAEHLEDGSVRVTISGPGVLTFSVSVSADEVVQMPSQVSIVSTFPNPTSGSLSIRYHVGEAGLTTIRVFDSLGRVREVLVDADRPSGQHNLMWDAASAGLPSGLYLIELQNGSSYARSTFILNR